MPPNQYGQQPNYYLPQQPQQQQYNPQQAQVYHNSAPQQRSQSPYPGQNSASPAPASQPGSKHQAGLLNGLLGGGGSGNSAPNHHAGGGHHGGPPPRGYGGMGGGGGMDMFGGGGGGGGGNQGQGQRPPLNNGPSHQQPSQPNGSQAASTPHWVQQLNFANLSRQSNSPHHHARAAHLAARGLGSSAVAITEPVGRMGFSKPGSHGGSSTPGTNGFGHRAAEHDPLTSSPTSTSNILATTANGDGKDSSSTPSWTTIDMGGMNLKNVSIELFRYTFLTTLYLPHNALTSLPGAVSKLVNLTLLDASSNKLTTLPPELGLLTHLRDLFLFDNHLTSLPPELGTLHVLDTLGIEGNPLPESMRSLLEKEGTTALIAYLRDSCPVPLPPPERDWVTVEPDSFPSLNPGGKPDVNFSVLCYNILNEKYATGSMYGYTPSWALAWDYRKELILQELMNYSSDIICLQEVDAEQYEEYFLENLQGQDYDGVYYAKSRSRTMTGDEKRHVDGCATFFKNTTFALVEQQLIEFNQIALRRPDFKKTEDMFNRVMTKDHIAVVTLLEHRASGARLIVANAHIHWDPEFRDVKLVQVAMLMEEVTRIGNDFAKLPARMNLAEGYPSAPTYANGSKIPTIVCGDFNSVPDSGVYELLSRGEVAKDHEDFMKHDYGSYTTDGLHHPLALKSSYSHIGELPFTNYTPGFQGVIDYIWYTTPSLSVMGLLGEVDREYLSRQVGFPNAHTPSDHISLYAQLSIR